MKTRLLLPAAGMGLRLGCDGPKALVDLDGRPMLAVTLDRFAGLDLALPVIITASADFLPLFDAVLTNARPALPWQLVAGGADRQESVALGLAALEGDVDIVVIHDAARPFVAAQSIRDSITAAQAHGAATVAVPVVDTILEADSEAFLAATPDRSRLWACQTPQTFRLEVILEAHRRAAAEGHCGTDDASLVRRMGLPVKLVRGTPENIKVTTPFDLRTARWMVREGKP